MEKWDYYISGIWRQKTGDKESITDVFLHTANGGFGKGVKTSKDEIAGLLKDGAKITTVTWNYYLVQWRFGAKVEFGHDDDGETYLHTEVGAPIFDDLESSIQMQYILTDIPVTVLQR